MIPKYTFKCNSNQNVGFKPKYHPRNNFIFPFKNYCPLQAEQKMRRKINIRKPRLVYFHQMRVHRYHFISFDNYSCNQVLKDIEKVSLSDDNKYWYAIRPWYRNWDKNNFKGDLSLTFIVLIPTKEKIDITPLVVITFFLSNKFFLYDALKRNTIHEPPQEKKVYCHFK